MDLELTPEQQQLEREVYTYLKENRPPELDEESKTYIEGDGPVCREFIRKLGRDGWMGIGWPKEYGGQDRTPIEQYIFFDLAMGYFRIAVPVLTLMTVGPTIMKVGSDEQRKKFLPPILTGDLVFAIAYTEPEAGTDLFSLKTTAVRDGDDYIINGQKIFTSMGHFADYFWLAARTNPNAAKQHEGISIFLVDANSPGITIEPINVMGGFRVNHEFFDNHLPSGRQRRPNGANDHSNQCTLVNKHPASGLGIAENCGNISIQIRDVRSKLSVQFFYNAEIRERGTPDRHAVQQFILVHHQLVQLVIRRSQFLLRHFLMPHTHFSYPG